MYRIFYCLLSLSVLGQSGVAEDAIESHSMGDLNLVGMYRIVSAEGPDAVSDWRGFAAITRSCGLISNHDGTAPLPFRFRTAKQGGQNLIDLIVSGDTENNTLYGIYEITGDTVRICMAPEDSVATRGRPQSFKAADARYFLKLVLKRVADGKPTEKSDSSPNNDAPPKTPTLGYQSLIEIQPHSTNPFAINTSPLELLIEADKQLAQSQLVKIKQEMADLVTRYPTTPAAGELTTILDKAGLKVIPRYGIYPKDVICITVPVLR